MKPALRFSLFLFITLVLPNSARADNPYTTFTTVSGVKFGYRVANESKQDKVLLRVENTTDKKVQIFFRLWCKSASGQEKLEGGTGFNMKPETVEQGGWAGLWYLPFGDNEKVANVQLREVIVNPLDQPWGAWKSDTSYPQISFRVRTGEWNRYSKNYEWFVQLRHTYGQTAHFDYGISAKKSEARTPYRIHLKAGAIHEQEFAKLLPLKPEEGAKVLLWLNDVRLGEEDKRRFVSPK